MVKIETRIITEKEKNMCMKGKQYKTYVVTAVGLFLII